jgi:hypothetical protein
MTCDEIRAQIGTLEALHAVLGTIEDLSGAELPDDEIVNLTFSDREKAPLVTAYAIPKPVALVGLRAMQQALEQMLSKETA